MTEVLAVQAWGPEFNPQSPHEKPGGMLCICNPIAWDVETGGSLDSLSASLSLLGEFHGKVRKILSQKQKQKTKTNAKHHHHHQQQKTR